MGRPQQSRPISRYPLGREGFCMRGAPGSLIKPVTPLFHEMQDILMRLARSIGRTLHRAPFVPYDALPEHPAAATETPDQEIGYLEQPLAAIGVGDHDPQGAIVTQNP